MVRKTAAVFLILFTGLCMTVLRDARGSEISRGRDYQKVIRTAREVLWKAITNGHGCGATVAVMDNGEIVYSEGIGVRDRASNSPVDRDTRFNIGSTSKMFAAVAVLLLVDEGKVSLDERVTRYIPDFTMKDERYHDITVRMLFNHSPGLPGSSFYFGYEPDSRMHELLLETLAGAHLKHRPGAMSIYCNDGFTLAEILVERVSGKKYMDFLSERIFKPLGMNNTGASIGEIQERDMAEYYENKSGTRYPPEVVPVYGAGGLSSTAGDLCRFGNSFNPKGTQILSESSLREIRKRQPSEFADKLRNRQILDSFGWEYCSLSPFDEKGIQVLGKGGNTVCYSANLQIVPDEGITIGLCISGHINGESLTRPILDALLEGKGLISPGEAHASMPPEPQEIPADLDHYEGYYASGEQAVKLRIDHKNKKVDLIPPAGSRDKEEKKPVCSFFYSGGYLFNREKDMKCYLTTVDGKSFLVHSGIPDYKADILLYQKLDLLREPRSLACDIDDKIWLMRNASPFILHSSMGMLNSCVYKDLMGYVDFGGLRKVESPTCAGIAATCFRDQTEVSLFKKDGRQWAKSGIYQFSMADSAAKAVKGENRVTIGAQGYNEWLRIEKGSVLSFDKPEKGRLAVLHEDEVLYDSISDTGEIFAPEGSFVFCAGRAGDVFTIQVNQER